MCKLAGKHVAYDGKVLGVMVIGYMFSSHDKGAHSRRNANRPDPNKDYLIFSAAWWLVKT